MRLPQDLHSSVGLALVANFRRLKVPQSVKVARTSALMVSQVKIGFVFHIGHGEVVICHAGVTMKEVIEVEAGETSEIGESVGKHPKQGVSGVGGTSYKRLARVSEWGG